MTGKNKKNETLLSHLGRDPQKFHGAVNVPVFRASTILGFVGAGGLGIYLRMNIQELEYENAMGVITLIIGLVILSEVTSHYLRGRFYRD